MESTDFKLINRTLSGEQEAFTELVMRYQKRVHALAWRKIGDFHIAEEITQDTFLRAYKNLGALKNPNLFAGWLYRIAHRLCNTWFEKRGPEIQSLDGLPTVELEKLRYSEYMEHQLDERASEKRIDIVKRLLQKLPESERIVITLHYLAGSSIKEISDFLGVSLNTVKSRLYRARQRLQKEEHMIRETLGSYQPSTNLTESIIKHIKETGAQINPTTPSGSKPFLPWTIAASSTVLLVLLIGVCSQRLVRFQQSYSLEAQAETKVELVDVPFLQHLNAKSDLQAMLGRPNAPGNNNGPSQQTDDSDSLDLDTIIAKIKHYDNVVTSVTGDFTIERHRNIKRNTEPQIEKDEFKLTFEGEKVRLEPKKSRYINTPVIKLWDGEQHWEVSLPQPNNLLIKVEITPNKESTFLEKIHQAFKKVGIEIAEDVQIVKGDLRNSYRVIEKEESYFVLFVGETTLEIYKRNVGYAVRPYWAIMPSDQDPRSWLTFPNDASSNSYLSQPLWQLLEKYESKIIGNEVLDGEETTVIHLTKPARTIGDRQTRPQHLKLWISLDKGFRLVKSEETFTSEDTQESSVFKFGETYINTRKVEYHEYLPDVWFPKRIERYTHPKEGNFLFKTVFITKQCQLNTDVSKLLRLDISPDTPVYDHGVDNLRKVDELETKPNFEIQLNTLVPNRNDAIKQEVSDSDTSDLLQKHLPEGAITRIGKGRIYDLAYSMDGTCLAIASSIGIWLYDTHSGKALDLLTRHAAKVSSVAFSPDGKTLASACNDNTIHLWDARIGTHLRTITGRTVSITGIVFSADGKTFASGSNDNTIRLWNTQTGEIQGTLIGHTDRIMSVVFSPDGRTLASVGKDSTIRLWNILTGENRETFILEQSQDIFKMKFSTDGNTLASWGFEGPIRLWDVKTGIIRHTLPLQQLDIVNDIAFSRDGKTLASAMNNGTVHLWDVQAGEHLRILIGHTHWVLRVEFNHDGKTLASGSFDATIRLWDVQTGKLRKTLTGHLGDIVCVAFSPDGKTLANVIEDDTIRMWDTQKGALLRILKKQDMSSITDAAFSPDGKTLASGNESRAICLWDMQTGNVDKTFREHQGLVTSVVFSPDGAMLASASWDKTINLHDAQTGKLHRTFTGHTDWVMSVAFSPDGKMLASGSKDNTVRLWNVQTGENTKTLTGHTNVVFSVAFNPDGKTIASGSHDGLIHLWDVQTGENLKTTGHTDWVMSVAFSPDGKTLASGSKDNTVHLWDTQRNIVQQIYEGHTSWVTSVAFSSDGRTLASGSRDGTSLLWKITPDNDELK